MRPLLLFIGVCALGFGGGVAVVAAIPGPSAKTLGAGGDRDACGSRLASARSACTDNLSTRDGNSHALRIDEAGRYRIEVTPPPGRKFPLDAQLRIDGSDRVMLADAHAPGAGKPAAVTVPLSAGDYWIVVQDAGGVTVTGGFDYALSVALDEARPLVAPLGAPEPAPASRRVADAKEGR